MDKLEEFYNYLKGANANVPDTYDSFVNVLGDSSKREDYYNYLKSNKFNVPDDFETFNSTLFNNEQPLEKENNINKFKSEQPLEKGDLIKSIDKKYPKEETTENDKYIPLPKNDYFYDKDKKLEKDTYTINERRGLEENTDTNTEDVKIDGFDNNRMIDLTQKMRESAILTNDDIKNIDSEFDRLKSGELTMFEHFKIGLSKNDFLKKTFNLKDKADYSLITKNERKQRIAQVIQHKQSEFFNSLDPVELKTFKSYLVKRNDKITDETVMAISFNERLEKDVFKSEVGAVKEYDAKMKKIESKGNNVTEEDMLIYNDLAEKKQGKIENLKLLKTQYDTNRETILKNEDDVLTFEGELDLAKRDYNVSRISEMASGLGFLAENVAQFTGIVATEAMKYNPNLIGQTANIYKTQEFFKNWAIDTQDTKERLENSRALKISFADVHNTSDFGSYMGNLITEQAPIFFAIAATGGLGVGVVSASSGGDRMGQLLKGKEEGTNNYSMLQIVGNGLLYASGEYVGESITFGLLKKYKKLIQASKGNKLFASSFKEALKNGTKSLGTLLATAHTEGMSEVYTEAIQLLADNLQLDEKRDSQFKESYLGGFFMGAGMHVLGSGFSTVAKIPSAVIGEFSRQKNKKKVKENVSRIVELQKIIEQGNFTPSIKALYQDEINLLSAENAGIMNQSAKEITYLSPRNIKLVSSINNKIASFKLAYKNNKSEAVRKSLIEKVEVLEKEKETILTKANPLNSLEDKGFKLKKESSAILTKEKQDKGDKNFEITDKEITLKAIELLDTQNNHVVKATETKEPTKVDEKVDKDLEKEVMEGFDKLDDETTEKIIQETDDNNNIAEQQDLKEQAIQSLKPAITTKEVTPTLNTNEKKEKGDTTINEDVSVRDSKDASKGKDNSIQPTAKLTESKTDVKVEKTLTNGEKRKNSLIDLKNEFNRLSNHKKRSKNGQLLSQKILHLSSELGFTLKPLPNGKLSLTYKDGKNVGKTNIREVIPNAKNEDVNYAKAVIAAGHVFSGDAKMMRNDLGISQADVKKGIADIEKGNYKSTPAKRLIQAIKEAKEQGGFHIKEGMGGQIQNSFVPINYVNDNITVELTNDEIAEVEKNKIELQEEYNSWIETLNDEELNKEYEYYGKNSKRETISTTNDRESKKNVLNEKEPSQKTEGGTSQPTKVSNKSTQGKLRKGSETDSRMAKIASYIRRSIETAKGKGEVNLHDQQDLEAQKAIDVAEKENLWVENQNDLGTPFSSGHENNNYLDNAVKFVYKVNNLQNVVGLISNLFDKIKYHNMLFPLTTYRFVGFTGNKNRLTSIQPIFNQKYFAETVKATPQEIKTYMESLGFKQTTPESYVNGEYLVFDLFPRNVLKDKNGVIYIIDAEIKKIESNAKKVEFTEKDVPDLGTKKEIVFNNKRFSVIRERKLGDSTSVYLVTNYQINENGETEYLENSKGEIEIELETKKEVADYLNKKQKGYKLQESKKTPRTKKEADKKPTLKEGDKVSYKYLGQKGTGVVDGYGYVVADSDGKMILPNQLSNITSADGKIKYQVDTKETEKPKVKLKIFTHLTNLLNKTKLARKVVLQTSAEMVDFLEKVGQNNVTITPNGFVYKGKMYLNTDKAKLDTPIHEFAHLWNSYLKENHRAVYERGLSLMKGTQYLKDVKSNPAYNHLTERQKREEALSQAIGEKGAKIYEERKKNKFIAWIENAFKKIANKLGLRDLSGAELMNLTLDEYTTLASADLLGGKEIKLDQINEKLSKKDKLDFNKVIQFQINNNTDIPTKERNGMFTAMRNALKTAKTKSDVIKAATEFIANTDWYKNLSEEQKEDILNKDIPNTDIFSFVQKELLKKEENMGDLEKLLKKTTAIYKRLQSRNANVISLQKQLKKHINTVIKADKMNEFTKTHLSKIMTALNKRLTAKSLQIQIEKINDISLDLDSKKKDKKIKSILSKNTSKLVGGLRKGNLTDGEISKIIKGVQAIVKDFSTKIGRGATPIKSIKVDKINFVSALQTEFLELLDKKNKTESDILEITIKQLALQYLQAQVETSSRAKNAQLSQFLEDITAIYQKGKSNLKEKIEERKEKDNTLLKELDEDANPKGKRTIFTDNELKDNNKKIESALRRFFYNWFQGKVSGSLDSISTLISKKGGDNRDSSAWVKLTNYFKQRETFKKTRIKQQVADIVLVKKIIFGGLKKGERVLKTKVEITIHKHFFNDKNTPIGKVKKTYTYAQLLNVWMNAHNTDNLPGLENNGFTEEVLSEIESVLPKSVKDYGRYLFEHYKKDWEQVNEVYESMNYHPLGNPEFYAGKLIREGYSVEQDNNVLLGNNKRSMSYGSLKERVNNSLPIEAIDVDLLLMRQINESSHYIAFAEAHRKYSKILSDKKISQSILLNNGKYGDKILESLNFYKVRMEKGGDVGWKLLDKVFRNIAVATLALKPKIFITQTISVINAAFEMPIGLGVKGFAKHYNPKMMASSYKYLINNSTYLKNRYDKDGLQNLAFALTDMANKSELTIKNTSLESGRKQIAKFFKDYQNLIMANVKYGDKIGVMGALPIYSSYLEKYSKTHSKEVAEKMALEKFESVVDRSQQTTSDFGKSEWQLDKHARYYMMFTSTVIQNQQNANYYRRELERSIKGKGHKGSNIRNLFAFMNYQFAQPLLYTYISQMLAGSIISALGFGDDEPDDNDKSMLSAMVLGNVNSIPVIGSMLLYSLDKFVLDKKHTFGGVINNNVYEKLLQTEGYITKYIEGKSETTRNKNLKKAVANISMMLVSFPDYALDMINEMEDVYWSDEYTLKERIEHGLGYSKWVIDNDKKTPKKEPKKEEDTLPIWK